MLDTPFVFKLKCILYAHTFVISVPGPVQGLVVVSVMERKLNISWEEPAEPNDYILNYTVTITDISTGTELSRTVILDMDKDKFTILSDTIGMIDLTMLNNYLECVKILTCFSGESSLQCDCICY